MLDATLESRRTRTSARSTASVVSGFRPSTSCKTSSRERNRLRSLSLSLSRSSLFFSFSFRLSVYLSVHLPLSLLVPEDCSAKSGNEVTEKRRSARKPIFRHVCDTHASVGRKWKEKTHTHTHATHLRTTIQTFTRTPVRQNGGNA